MCILSRSLWHIRIGHMLKCSFFYINSKSSAWPYHRNLKLYIKCTPLISIWQESTWSFASLLFFIYTSFFESCMLYTSKSVNYFLYIYKTPNLSKTFKRCITNGKTNIVDFFLFPTYVQLIQINVHRCVYIQTTPEKCNSNTEKYRTRPCTNACIITFSLFLIITFPSAPFESKKKCTQ